MERILTFAAMKPFHHIVVLALLFSVVACGSEPQHASPEDLQEAQTHYDSGYVFLQQDSLMRAFPFDAPSGAGRKKREILSFSVGLELFSTGISKGVKAR